MTMMDSLHLMGVDFIQDIQQNFKGHSELMLFLSHLGDPPNAFLLCFPLAYCCHRATGIRVIWAGVISEWLNALFKWILFGQRPYWWVNETDLYKEDRPHLDQFRLTCETGPGSPSGHAMVTAAVWFVVVRSLLLLYKGPLKQVLTAVLWFSFALLMALVSFSRCFIATHFPHQVIFGSIVGALIGEFCLYLPLHKIKLKEYIISVLVILLSCPGLYWFVGALGYDPMWTIELAQRWCARSEWVYLNSFLFYAIIRDAIVLLGTGCGLYLQEFVFTQDQPKSDVESPSPLKLATMISLSVVLSQAVEHFNLPQTGVTVFYIMAVVKYLFLPIVSVICVPQICSFLFKDKDSSDNKSR